MPARLISKAKEIRDDGSIVEIVVWEVPEPLLPCTHLCKYRLYYGAAGVDRVRYDNELGKGDHRHVQGVEEVYVFSNLDALLNDFQRDVQNWS
jgi:Family of unknown function (DUF6516)